MRKKGYKKSDHYPKYLYVIYDDKMPIYVGVTAYPVSHRFSSTYRSEYIMQNKDRLTYRVVDHIFNEDQLYKEQELILYFIEQGYKLENKIICQGAGIPTGKKHRLKRHSSEALKINGEPQNIITAKIHLRSGKHKKSNLIERKAKIEVIKNHLDSGLNIYQIAKLMNADYGNLYKFIKKYITSEQKP